MRIILNNTEFFVFKELYYFQNRSVFYYQNQHTTLVDKYFNKNTPYRLSASTVQILDTLIKSPIIPELIQEPKVVNCSLYEQLDELKGFLSTYFKIFIDDRNRFYQINKKMGGFKRNKKNGMLKIEKDKNIVTYYSWQDMIQLYNNSYSSIVNFNTIENKNLVRLYKNIPFLDNGLTYRKKFQYLNLKRTKKGFKIDSDVLVTLPY